MAGGLHYEDPALIIDFHRYRALESLLTFVQALGYLPAFHCKRIQLHAFLSPLGQCCLAGQLGDETAICVEHLKAVVFEVGDINGSIFVNGDSGGPIELAIYLSGSSKLNK